MGNIVNDGQRIKGDLYVLPRSDIERERLQDQHAHLTEVLSGRLIFDERVQLAPGDRVLDCGTGAASWALALSIKVQESVEIVGADISPVMFPKEVPTNVKLQEASSTNMPAEWGNRFALVNQRLLVAAFTVAQWRAALNKMLRVLRPGGNVQLMEAGRYGSLKVPLETLPATLKMADLASAVMNHSDLLGIQCGQVLPGMLSEVGFSEIQVETHQVPVGRQWGEIGVKGSAIRDVLLRGFGVALLAEGGLGICGSQAGVDEMIEQAKKEWDETPGVFVHYYTISAKKPL